MSSNVLCSVLDFDRSSLALARSRRAAADGVYPVHLLDVPGAGLDGTQPEPGDRRLAVLTGLGREGRGHGGVLGAVRVADGRAIVLEHEERDALAGEEVVARDGEVARPQAAVRLLLGEVEVHGHDGQLVEQVRVQGADAAGVEEGRDGASGDGDGCRVAGVAGVVLGATADGDVHEGQAVSGLAESLGCGWACGVSTYKLHIKLGELSTHLQVA